MRDPLAPAAQILRDLPRCAEGTSKLIVVKLDSTQDSDAKNVVEEIQTVCIYLIYLGSLDKKRTFHIIPFDDKHTQQAQKKRKKKRQNIPGTYLTPSLSPTSPDPLDNPSRPRLRQRRNPPPRKSHTRILTRHFLDSAKFRNQHHSSNSTLSSHETTARSSGKSEICRKYLTYTICLPYLIYRRYINLHNLIQQTCR